MKKLIIFSVFITLLAVGCQDPTVQDPPATPPGPTDPNKGEPPSGSGEKLNVLLFSAPWCDACNKELPEIRRVFKELKVAPENLIALVHVVSGKTPTQPATQKVADEYKLSLGFEYEFIADRFCKTYHLYYSHSSCEIPAAVVTKQSGEVLKAFTPGQFTPTDLLDFVKGKLQ